MAAKKLLGIFIATICCVCLLASCTGLWQGLSGAGARRGVSSSLVDFLYPEGGAPAAVTEQTPNLALPLRVGLAFVPSNMPVVEGLSEAEKQKLLETAREGFIDREYISEITIIPDTYLRAGKGFNTIEQVGRLYGLDVIALVSYDQVVHGDDTRASILYWTIVGAYFIKGSKNDVQTFVDTAIFDLRSRQLLLRAPGSNTVVASSTLVDSARAMREAREESFTLAMQDMAKNLDRELDRFKERIKQDRSVTVSHRQGYGGGGALDIVQWLMLAAIGLLPVVSGWRRG